MGAYDPRTAQFLCFANAKRDFAAGTDSPRALLERCITTLAACEPSVHAFAALCIEEAREAADRSSERWEAGQPLSAVDGMPVGIKDCYDVRGLHTRANSAYFDDAPVAETDAAHVDALRRGGAVIVGKTDTTELTMAEGPPTRNPWDLRRTPGGSSSGSAAAVAAGVLPLGTGSQIRGSIVRPASICGVIGMKPTLGALNQQGGIDNRSCNHLGFLAGSLIDIWETAHHIAHVVGGDPGHEPWRGGAAMPAARRPLRIGRQYTAGWPETDSASQAAFERFLLALRERGIEVVEPAATVELGRYEAATAAAASFFFDLCAWELRWPLLAWHDAKPDRFSKTMIGAIERASRATLASYRAAQAACADLRTQHHSFASELDAFITLAHIGPGQLGNPPIGTPLYNDASSAIGAPSFNLPVLDVDGAPLGVQIMGFASQDEDLVSIARWFLETFTPQL